MTAQNLELIHQSVAPSLVRNGAFTSGLAHWFGSYCRHVDVLPSLIASPAPNAPKYVAEINAVGDDYYMDGVTPGLNQFIDRPDLFSYPSVRIVSSLRMLPLGLDQALLQIQPSLTSVDGVQLSSAAAPEYFQHPFLYRDVSTTVPIAVGAPVHVADARDTSNSILSKAVRVWLNYGGAVTVPTVGQEHLLTYHALEVRTNQNTFTPFADQTLGKINLTLSNWTATSATIVISGDINTLKSVDRNQLGFTQTGPQIDDILVIDGYPVTVTLVSAPIGSTVITLTVGTVKNFGQDVRQFISAGVDLSVWAFYAPAVVTASVTKNLYKYEFTTFHTYNDTLGASAVPALKFLELREDPSKEYLTTLGFGYDGEEIPIVDSRTETMKLADTSGTPDSTWRRESNYFLRESPTLLGGRLQFTIKPELGTTPDAFGTFAISGLAYNGATTQFPNGRLTITVLWGSIPTPITVRPGFSFMVNAALLTLEAAWQTALDTAPFTLDSYNDFTFQGVNGSNLYVQWPAGVAAPQGLASVNLNAQNVAMLFGIAGAAKAQVGDVYVIKGSYNTRFQLVDDVLFPEQYPATYNVLLDHLQHKIDEADNVLPRGCVILYDGGGVCPPGYKRIDGFVDSANPGLEDYETIPMPALPGESVTYDTVTNRTTLTWIQDFSAIDEDGDTISIPELSEPRTLDLGNGVIQNLLSTPRQQVFQPGMRLRYPSFTTPASVVGPTGNPLFNSTSTGSAIRTIPQPGAQLNSGRLHMPAYASIEIGSTRPNTNSVTFELWGKLNSLPSASAVLAQQGRSNNRGWQINIEPDGNLRFFIYDGSVTSYTTSGRPLLQAAMLGFIHIVCTLVPHVQNASLEDGCQIQIRTTGSLIYNQIFNMGSGASSLTSTSDIYLGRGAGTGSNEDGLDFTFDLFRVFKTNALTTTPVQLWNSGLGVSDLRFVPGAYSALLAEYRFDEAAGTALLNTAPLVGALHGTAEGAPIPQRITGHLSVVGSGEFPVDSFGAIREADTPSYLITDVQFRPNVGQTQMDPAAPANSSGSKYGSGARGMLSNSSPIKISYHTVIRSNSNVPVYELSTPPPGPYEENQQLARIGTSVLGATNGTYVPTVTSLVSISGRVESATIQYAPTNTGPNTGDEQDFHNNLTVGDVYYFTCLGGSNGGRGNFFARVTSLNKSTYHFTIKRYDGPYFNKPVSSSPFLFFLPYLIVGATLTIRPAMLFGIGAQGIDPATQDITIPGITVTRTDANNIIYWSYQLFTYDVSVTLYGQLTPVSGLNTLYLEPSGYLVYDDPSSTAKYGDNGHSHLVGQGDVTTTTELVPRVNEEGRFEDTGNPATTLIPFTAVASKHTHGFLPRYRYALPAFKMFTLCERL